MGAMISKAEYAVLEGKYNALRYRLEQLERLLFAAKSERFAPASAPGQMELFEAAAAAGAQ